MCYFSVHVGIVSQFRNLGWEHSPILNWNAHADRLHLETRKLGFLSCASASFPWSGKIRVSMYPINRFFGKQSSWRVFAAHVGLDGDPSSLSHEDQLSNIDEHAQRDDDDASNGVLPKKLGPDEVNHCLRKHIKFMVCNINDLVFGSSLELFTSGESSNFG